PVIELLEARDPLGLRLDEESLTDEAIQPFLLASSLGRIGSAVNQSDSKHRAGALNGGIGVRGAVIHVHLFWQSTSLNCCPQHLLAGAGGLLGEPAAMEQEARMVIHQQE